MSIIYINKHNYWHNFRNIRELLGVAYYAPFARTIYQSQHGPAIFGLSIVFADHKFCNLEVKAIIRGEERQEK